MDEWKLLHQFNQFKQSNIKKKKEWNITTTSFIYYSKDKTIAVKGSNIVSSRNIYSEVLFKKVPQKYFPELKVKHAPRRPIFNKVGLQPTKNGYII